MSGPVLVRSVVDMQQASMKARSSGTVGLVPTMGALHDGHRSLVDAAKAACDTVVVSIFVNPTQFGPGEDYERYPRTFDSDLELLRQQNVAYVFAPSVDDLYPAGASTFIDVGSLGERLDGQYRPGHFRGVATVVAKLFHCTTPHFAFFGQKDAAQVAVLKAMVRDLNFDLNIVVCPTVREPDGLAMSSRNQYLTMNEREQALVLYRALQAARQAYGSGVHDPEQLRAIMHRHIAIEPAATLEYAEVVCPDTLVPAGDLSKGALLAVAARIGGTRLIDNLVLQPVAEPLSP